MGFFKKADTFLKESGAKYKQWKTESPERLKAKKEKLKEQLEIRELKEKISNAKYREQMKKMKLR